MNLNLTIIFPILKIDLPLFIEPKKIFDLFIIEIILIHFEVTLKIAEYSRWHSTSEVIEWLVCSLETLHVKASFLRLACS